MLVSLGNTCHPAIMIRKYSECKTSFPFDWGYISINGLLKIIDDREKSIDIIKKNVIQFAEKEFKVECYEYQISHISNDINEIKTTIERRMYRFFDYINRDDTFCIRYNSDKFYTKVELPLNCKYGIVNNLINCDTIQINDKDVISWEDYIKNIVKEIQ